MPSARADAAPVSARSGYVRWAMLLGTSVLLHVMVFSWASGALVLPAHEKKEPTVLIATLLAPPPPPPPPPKSMPKPPKQVTQAPAKPAPKAKPKAKPKQTASKPAKPHQPPPPAAMVRTDPPAVPAAADGSAESPLAPSPETADAPLQQDTPSLAELMPEREPVAVTPQLLWQAVDLPPSAELHFEVHALKKDQPWYGNGVFRWESNGGRYTLTGEASATLLFFNITALNFTSEGVINEFGVAPLRYTEQPRGKQATETLFQHETRTIRFAATNSSHSYYGGVQDRASVVWQLAGIGRASPEQFRAGAELDLTVAGPRDADAWTIQVIGLEQIDTGGTMVDAWHVARVKQRQAGDQRIDFWLAPERHWYPVKIRQSEANGEHLTLTLDEVRPLATEQPQHMEQE